ncbi:restriction endonuclease-like protein [Cohnella thailandensis]|uniref:DUF2357 domain-containing protein n=1 Tax=Cohnella thailandensis TaxID=557557 RepID=A0A841T4P0_9BACL|nr:restriction endonuclease-like protein [Cohnella thailandensis]MBB6637615.1 DUF2357 domain-containing protein [Cohnella thailandensis]MBP1974209.1 putative component of viral defense system (DUF524 family) [Cohnella thailandensis]
MDSLPIGSPNQTVELLRIETDLFTLFLQGKPFHPTVESMQLHRTEDQRLLQAHLQVASLTSRMNVEQVLTYNPEINALMDWGNGINSYPVFFETQEYSLVIEKKQTEELAFYHENVKLRQAIKPLGSNLLTGILKFQNEVGLTELEIRWNGQPALRIQIEIYPSKMDYKTDYQMILNDVNKQIYNLSFDFLRKTYHLTGLRETRNQSLAEYFTILQHVFRQLVQAVERISMAPHSKHHKEYKITEASRARQAAKDTIAYLHRNPHLLVADSKLGFIPANGERYYPTHVRQAKRQINYDTNENRFIRWVLVRISKKLSEMKTRLAHQERYQDPELTRKIADMQTQLQRLLKLDFLNVSEMNQLTVTLVLQMAPGYRDVYRNYLMLMKGLSIQSDLFRLSMKDLAQLYEYWCFLKIHELLSRKYELLQQDIIKVDRTGIFVKLDRGHNATMKYRNSRNGEVFTLYYNSLPSGEKTPTVGQRPDNILTLKKNDSAHEYKYIFDAKYRLNPAYEGTPYHRDYKNPGPEESDINTMHRYRDAIVYEDGNGRELERSMFGAYVLFPYHDEEKFREHKFYKSIELINVGAFPFLPNSTNLMEAFLDEIIMDSPEKAYERSTRPRGTKDYYRDKFSGKNMLVGSLRGPSQLEDALRYGFYHVPLKNISDHKVLTQLEYVALYQSREKFKQPEHTGVQWYGRIVDWKVLQRKEITERPPRVGSEEKLYVKFIVEKWLKRQTPIIPGGQGIYTLLYTSKYLFDRARELAELRLEAEEDLALWREKRRLGPVIVELDHEQVDLAELVKGIWLRE